MNDNMVITECRIEKPMGWGDTAKIYVKYEGMEEWEKLYEYFVDELYFYADEFIGLTKTQANRVLFTAEMSLI